MKIKDNSKTASVQVGDIPNGEVFIDRRRSNLDELVLFMKICADSFLHEDERSCYAINLVTGRMRRYSKTDTVQLANAEVNLIG